MLFKLLKNKLALLIVPAFLLIQGTTNAQVKWMSVGSLHNWYSERGAEWEEGGPVKEQQYGLQWPAGIARRADSQAWKALWIGAKNFTDEKGVTWANKVVHVGPRVVGLDEIYPVKFRAVSKFEKPVNTVDGSLTESINAIDVIDSIDPNLPADRMIEIVVNSKLGLTMTRKVFQFGNQFHDNYIINEYVFTNTGNTDGDTDIELPNTTLQDVYVFMQYRIASNSESRYVIGNSTGWGMNTTIDSRGDGVKPDPENERFRAHFAWHGKLPAFTTYDNVGAPIWVPYYDKTDTSGRLGAPQFVGMLTLYASKSATDTSNDLSQPSTTKTFDSDGALQRNNSTLNVTQMNSEYAFMSSGHDQRHLDKIGESNPVMPTKDPATGTQGGYSFGDGYGPYTLQHGQSFRIVLAECVAGISREKAIEVGRQYKKDKDALKKNTAFFTGRDSLFQTFRRATANFNSGWTIAQSPMPPKELSVEGLGDRVELKWSTFPESEASIRGFQIFRSIGRVDSTYRLIAEVPASERIYKDVTAPRGVNCYYYISTIGDATTANPSLNIPVTRLVSNRLYGQTFDPTFLKRKPGESLSEIRIVPNPYNISADRDKLRFSEATDRLFFYNIPGDCSIKIYTEYGELIKSINHTNGSGDESWDCVTESNQIVVSGLYLAVVKDNKTGDSKILKFVVIR